MVAWDNYNSLQHDGELKEPTVFISLKATSLGGGDARDVLDSASGRNWMEVGLTCLPGHHVMSILCAHRNCLTMARGWCSRGYKTHSGTEGESDHENSDAVETSQPPALRKGGGSTAMKKRLELDAQGQPFGSMKSVFCRDIKKYAKDLDPTTGWEGQPGQERKRLFNCLYTGKLCTPDQACMCYSWC